MKKIIGVKLLIFEFLFICNIFVLIGKSWWHTDNVNFTMGVLGGSKLFIINNFDVKWSVFMAYLNYQLLPK